MRLTMPPLQHRARQVREDETFVVRFDDGSVEHRVPRACLRRRRIPPASTSALVVADESRVDDEQHG